MVPELGFEFGDGVVLVFVGEFLDPDGKVGHEQLLGPDLQVVLLLVQDDGVHAHDEHNHDEEVQAHHQYSHCRPRYFIVGVGDVDVLGSALGLHEDRGRESRVLILSFSQDIDAFLGEEILSQCVVATGLVHAVVLESLIDQGRGVHVVVAALLENGNVEVFLARSQPSMAGALLRRHSELNQ